MSTFLAHDGTKLFYRDWGTGQPIVFSHVSVPGHALRCGPETSVTSPLRWRWFDLRGHEKTYI